MIVQEPWWVFSRLFDDATCDRLVQHGEGLTREEGAMRNAEIGERRRTQIAWVREDWVYDLVEPWAYRANREAGWNLDVERMQSLQFGIYGEGGHYDWHYDQTGRPYSAKDEVAPEFHGLLRKISFSIALNAPEDYDGGHFELEVGLPDDPQRIERPNPERTRGTMLIFPSFLPHRVTPVTRGVRYSLVGWLCGKPWR